jgi:bacterioferritin-associated ferredoxin
MSLPFEEHASDDERLFCECNLISEKEVKDHLQSMLISSNGDVRLSDLPTWIEIQIKQLGCGSGCGQCLKDDSCLVKVMQNHLK